MKSKVFLPKFKRRPAVKTKTTTTDKPITATAKPGEKLERLQKVLSRAGIASRRAAEELILEGAVTVNGRLITELGSKVDTKTDRIKVHGKLIYTEVETVYLAFYKPRGMISALSDPEKRPCIGDLVKKIGTRVVPIGRLNFNSEGLLLLTNDGDLANLIFKKRDLPKTYLVKIKGHPTAKELEFMKKGIFTSEGVLRFSSFDFQEKLRAKSWLKLNVTEGSKLDIKEILNRRGLMVDKIIRSEIGHIDITELEPGDYKFLTKKDFQKLLTLKAKD